MQSVGVPGRRSRVDISIIFKCAARVKQRRETVTGEQRYSAGWGASGGAGEPDGDGGCESGVVCRGMVLPADIFIGGHATCNRARGIRTERCFAHLYPRSGDSPVRLSRSPLHHALPRSLAPRSLRAREPFFCSLSARACRAQGYPDPEG